MSSPINLSRLNSLLSLYLHSRLTAPRLSSLHALAESTFTAIVHDLDDAIALYNRFPTCLRKSPYTPQLFINTTNLKSISFQPLPTYTEVLRHLQQNPEDLEDVFTEMRDSSYFHYIYEIDNPEHLLANLLTLVYRCHLLSSVPLLRAKHAQISSTLEEMSALRFLLGSDNLHYRATRHWIIDWEEEGFSQELANTIATA